MIVAPVIMIILGALILAAALGVAWYWVVIAALGVVIVSLMVALAAADPWRLR